MTYTSRNKLESAGRTLAIAASFAMVGYLVAGMPSCSTKQTVIADTEIPPKPQL